MIIFWLLPSLICLLTFFIGIRLSGTTIEDEIKDITFEDFFQIFILILIWPLFIIFAFIFIVTELKFGISHISIWDFLIKERSFKKEAKEL